MKGIILAAGRGSRMGAGTDTLPKCRSILHGKSLLQWQLEGLGEAGIDDLGIVRGYLANTFNEALSYFDNPRWSETNMVMSLVCADRWLKADSCIISYSDIVYSARSVRTLMEAPGDITIAYDPDWIRLWGMRFEDPLSDAETFRLEGSRVIEIGNRANHVDEIEGQYMGLLKFSPHGWSLLHEFLTSHDPGQQDKMDMTSLLRGAIKEGIALNAVAIKDRWYEVDSESDLQTYQALDSLF